MVEGHISDTSLQELTDELNAMKPKDCSLSNLSHNIIIASGNAKINAFCNMP